MLTLLSLIAGGIIAETLRFAFVAFLKWRVEKHLHSVFPIVDDFLVEAVKKGGQFASPYISVVQEAIFDTDAFRKGIMALAPIRKFALSQFTNLYDPEILLQKVQEVGKSQ